MVILLLIDNYININNRRVGTDVVLHDRCVSKNLFNLTDRKKKYEREKKNANHGFSPG